MPTASDARDSTAEFGHAGSWSDGLSTGAASTPDAAAFLWLRGRGDEPERVTYAALFRRVASVALELRRAGLVGERALILHQPGPGFIHAFLGCLAGGVVAVPVYPPHSVHAEAALDRLQGIVHDCAPAIALTGSTLRSQLSPLAGRYPALARLSLIDTETMATDAQAPWAPPDLEDESPAFLQYTSGSTADPRGVIVTHRNITHNARRIGQALAVSPETRGLSWLPPYHDMGLIGHILQPLANRVESVLMSPLSFLQRPMRWLEEISRFRATVSFAPDFAYDLAVRKARPEHIERLDLTCWATAGNGAEPVRVETMERFAETFAACGFDRAAFRPSYGLAENTLLVSSRQGIVTTTVDRTALERDRVETVDGSPAGARRLVSVGIPAEGVNVEIVSTDTRTVLPEASIGEIWVSGSSVAAGYWDRPGQTAETFQARLAESNDLPFLRTGDLGFKLGGELYVTGRLKDLIVIDGRNHYPLDLELTIQNHPAVRIGGVMAFSVENSGAEVVVAVVEITRGMRAQMAVDSKWEEAAGAIRAAVASRHGLTVHDIIWVASGSLPRTGSGKPRRRACRELFRRGALPDVVAHT